MPPAYSVPAARDTLRAAELGDRRRHKAGERGGHGADAQLGALAGDVGDLRVGKPERPFGDGVGVLEQDLACAREPETAALSLEQPGADLALERGHLVGDRRLGQRKLARRAPASSENTCVAWTLPKVRRRRRSLS
jgi:hypothetical protein